MINWIEQQKAVALRKHPSARIPMYQPLPTIYNAQWEKATLDNPRTIPIDFAIWPSEDLADKLIKSYFDFENLLLPILNRVLFKRDYYALRWRKDRDFARLCLAVFALGSARTLDEPDVLWPGEHTAETSEASRNSSGWKYLQAVIATTTVGSSPATLEQLQVYAVSDPGSGRVLSRLTYARSTPF